MKVMANKIFINKQNIVECQVIGDQTSESITAMGEKIQDQLAQLKSERKPLLLLDDIIKIGQVTPNGRNMVVSLAKTLPYDRLAMLGNNGFIRLGANLIIRASGKARKLRYFTNRNEAVKWLQEISI
jgi:hypothetical protein